MDKYKSLLEQIKDGILKDMTKSERIVFLDKIKFMKGSQDALGEYYANMYKLNNSNNG